MTTDKPLIEIKNLKVLLGESLVLNDLDLQVQRGEVLGIVGASGSGKTTLLRAMLMLQRARAGSIRIFDHELTTATPETLLAIQQRWGVLFQQSALFSSLNVLENTGFPLREHTALNKQTILELALLKILLVGLPKEAAIKYPAELSGGMQKRAGLARAIVLDPELLFLDEPTAGLDPESAAELDQLIVNLKTMLGLTIVLVTHDLDSLWQVTDRVAFLHAGQILCVDTMAELTKNPNKFLQAFFNGPRGRAAAEKME